MTTLDRLAVGQTAIIDKVGGDPAVAQRLGEFGLFEGEQIEMVGFAPLGDPIEIKIGNTRLSLRKSEANGVHVSPI